MACQVAGAVTMEELDGNNMNNIIQLERPICPQCNKNLRGRHIRPLGGYYYTKFCNPCQTENKHGRRNALKKQYHKRGRSYLRYRKSTCEDCGFVPKHECQLDVDHVDGNRQNNDLSNLKTLCANCHRLKTQINKDNYSKKWRVA